MPNFLHRAGGPTEPLILDEEGECPRCEGPADSEGCAAPIDCGWLSYEPDYEGLARWEHR